MTASRVVEAAAPKHAPLHDAFEWDNKIAGHEYRLIQARTLIRAIVVVSDDEDSEEPRSVYVHVPPSNDQENGEYVPLAVVTLDEAAYKRALTEAQRYLDSAQHRFDELQRLAANRQDSTAAIAIAADGFQMIKRALDILKVA